MRPTSRPSRKAKSSIRTAFRARSGGDIVTKKPNPAYPRFLTADQAQWIKNAISDGYHRRNDYPPFELMSFHDRPRYHEYVCRVINDMTEPQPTNPQPQRGKSDGKSQRRSPPTHPVRGRHRARAAHPR